MKILVIKTNMRIHICNNVLKRLGRDFLRDTHGTGNCKQVSNDSAPYDTFKLQENMF